MSITKNRNNTKPVNRSFHGSLFFCFARLRRITFKFGTNFNALFPVVSMDFRPNWSMARVEKTVKGSH